MARWFLESLRKEPPEFRHRPETLGDVGADAEDLPHKMTAQLNRLGRRRQSPLHGVQIGPDAWTQACSCISEDGRPMRPVPDLDG